MTNEKVIPNTFITTALLGGRVDWLVIQILQEEKRKQENQK